MLANQVTTEGWYWMRPPREQRARAGLVATSNPPKGQGSSSILLMATTEDLSHSPIP